jgi:hypothetical protein
VWPLGIECLECIVQETLELAVFFRLLWRVFLRLTVHGVLLKHNARGTILEYLFGEIRATVKSDRTAAEDLL